MQRLGLTAAELRSYHATLLAPHERRISIQIQTLSGTPLRSSTVNVIEGQVVVDVTTEVTRVLNMRFVDPSRAMSFDGDDPSSLPLHRSRRIQVTYAVRVAALSRWVECVVFTGPIWDFQRNGAEVTITAHGMDRQAMGNQWQPRTFAKKSRKTRAIRDLLGDVGFTVMNIPDLPATFPGRFTVARMDQPWPKVKRVATSMDRHLFIDAEGIPQMRAFPNRPAFTFDERSLLADPEIRRTVEGLANVFEVIGGKPKGAKKRVRAVAALRDPHPLSPVSLSMNGQQLRLVEVDENPHVKKSADAKKRAKRLRDDRARLVVDYGFDTVPIPHLDEMDLVKVASDDGSFMVRMRQWTLPLGGTTAGGGVGPPMSVGTLRRTTRPGRRHA